MVGSLRVGLCLWMRPKNCNSDRCAPGEFVKSLPRPSSIDFSPMKIHICFLIILLAAGRNGFGGGPPTPTTLPLANGDFEAGPFDTVGSVTGWTVSGTGKVESKTQGATSGTHSAAFGVGGDSRGNILSQSFFT